MINLAKRLEPVTLVRSPIIWKLLSGRITKRSSPEKVLKCSGSSGIRRGVLPATAAAMAAMCSGVVPQQPPTTFTSPSAAQLPRCPPVVSGFSS